MTAAATALAQFACSLAYDDVPREVVERAKICIVDTIGDAYYGSRLPWSRMILDYAQRNGAAGEASVIGTRARLKPCFAALANGAFAHAFELDSMCQPSVGAHPGASLTAPGLAVAQSNGNSGKELIAAFVAACEAMYRIGEAAHHTSEELGFHAPGLLGVFGGAVMASRLMHLDADRMANALGISGSLCCGILEFSKSGGGMVKRLHQGRASEGAVMAAELASEGYTGPSRVLEGEYGFLKTFCRDADATRLTAGLGEEWRTLRTTIKAYACHSTAHVAVTAALELKNRHAFTGEDIAEVRVAGSEKLVSHHAIHDPNDIATAQYSAPFSVALAFYLDPRDPDVFSEASLRHPGIRDLCRRTKVEIYTDGPKDNKLASRVAVKLRNGAEYVQELQYFPGMPQRPLDSEQLWEKFSRLTAKASPDRARRVFDAFLALETVENVAAIEMI